MPSVLRPLALLAALAIGACDGGRGSMPLAPGASTWTISPRPSRHVDKVDLLIVVDNSPGMDAPQITLARQIPSLIKAMVDPERDPKTGRLAPVMSLHVAVISSSLGSFGTSLCDPKRTNPHNDDRAHLLPRAGEGGGVGYVVDRVDAAPAAVTCPTAVPAMPIAWAAYRAKEPAARFVGKVETQTFEAAVSCAIGSVKDDGCSVSQPLEAAYRFLVDPRPYQSASADCSAGVDGDVCGTNKIVVTGVDDALLAQRAAFLRPDSLLAVVLLTNRNDASIKPAGLNWIPLAYPAGKMMRGWDKCASVPDDFEPETGADYDKLHAMGCFSCFESTGNPNCTLPWAKDPIDHDVDGRHVRLFAQVQRLGYDFDFGRQRYVDGFSKQFVPSTDASGRLVQVGNPIFEGGFRTTDLIVVLGILGVPSALVTSATGAAKPLGDAEWAKLIDPDLTKRDPHMIESIGPRTAFGAAKYAGDRGIDAVNGGDRHVLDGDDLQYACISKLPDGVTADGECKGASAESRSPLCDPGGTQSYFPAYPSLRELRVIHDLGTSGAVSSICGDPLNASTVMPGLIDRITELQDGSCTPILLAPSPDGEVDCMMLESFEGGTVDGAGHCEQVGKGYCTPGAAPCRDGGVDFPTLSPTDAAAHLFLTISVFGADGAKGTERAQAYADGGNVYVKARDGQVHLLCEVLQLAGHGTDAATTRSCLTDVGWSPSPGVGGGWCYASTSVDAELPVVGAACVRRGAPGRIRFVGDAQPRDGSEVYPACSNRVGGASATAR